MRQDEKKVREAIEALVMEGVETPTNDQFRSKLKGGSFSVIAPVLKSWREEKSRARIAALSMPVLVKDRIEIALAQICMLPMIYPVHN